MFTESLFSLHTTHLSVRHRGTYLSDFKQICTPFGKVYFPCPAFLCPHFNLSPPPQEVVKYSLGLGGICNSTLISIPISIGFPTTPRFSGQALSTWRGSLSSGRLRDPDPGQKVLLIDKSIGKKRKIKKSPKCWNNSIN